LDGRCYRRELPRRTGNHSYLMGLGQITPSSAFAFLDPKVIGETRSFAPNAMKPRPLQSVESPASVFCPCSVGVLRARVPSLLERLSEAVIRLLSGRTYAATSATERVSFSFRQVKPAHWRQWEEGKLAGQALCENTEFVHHSLRAAIDKIIATASDFSGKLNFKSPCYSTLARLEHFCRRRLYAVGLGPAPLIGRPTLSPCQLLPPSVGFRTRWRAHVHVRPKRIHGPGSGSRRLWQPDAGPIKLLEVSEIPTIRCSWNRVGWEPSFTVWSRKSFCLTATGERSVYELTAQP
jgi:hypothetical protein